MLHRLFAVLMLAGAFAVPAPAQAAACSGTSGVSVVVQFPDGHIETGCAPGDPSTGIQALKGAGFTPEPVPGQMGATVCRINGQPAAGEPCWQPPNYWAYFYAQRGGSWIYSDYGAGNRDPKPGTVEGWKFGGSRSNPPSTAPPGTPALTPTPDPTTPHPTTGASSSVKPGTTAHPGAGTSPTAPDATAATGGTAALTAGPSATATDDGAPTAGPTVTDGAAAPRASSNAAKATSSSSKSWVWGLLLIGVLGAGAGVTAVRRRRG
jgi:hypothetical protein